MILAQVQAFYSGFGRSHKTNVCLLFQPEELNYLNINLRLDAFIIKDSLNLYWTSEAGMVENMESIVEEYKETRQLLVSVQVCQMRESKLCLFLTLLPLY